MTDDLTRQATPVAGGSNKRAASTDSASGISKKTKTTHPFFQLAKDRSATQFWRENIDGKGGTCKHGIHQTLSKTDRLAIFDLDGTLIVPQEGRKHPTSSTDWQWWRKEVPSVLKTLHQQGFGITIVTNQKLTPSRIKAWTAKIPLIAEKLPDVPFRILAANGSDVYRKPLPGMWWALQRLAKADGMEIDVKTSFFVGDAAGRPADHSDCDRKWALNAGLQFFTPEEYFLKLPPAPYVLKGLDVTKLPTNLPYCVPTATPVAKPKGHKPEIVLFVGCPGLGKTTFYRKYFKPNGYAHVNQDKLKTRAKCLTSVEELITGGSSCVVDNTNRDIATRASYTALATKLKCPIRCFAFHGTVALAWHNVLYRTWCLTDESKEQEDTRQLVPYMALEKFYKEYQDPHADEGFDEIKKVNWKFDGSLEDLRRWSMWLEL